jgi:hypothetical protein
MSPFAKNLLPLRILFDQRKDFRFLDLARSIEWERLNAQGSHLDHSTELPVRAKHLEHTPDKVFCAFTIEALEYRDGFLAKSRV